MTRHRVLRAVTILFFCALFLLPLAFMITGSLRQAGLPPPNGFEWFPSQTDLGNYKTAFGLVEMKTFLINSLVIVAVAVPVTVLFASWAGFAIASSSPRMRRLLIGLSLVALMIPVTALWVPRFVMFKWLGIIDTPLPLMAPALMATSPFYVLLFALVYSRLPKGLFEAARLEGMSPFATWRRVAFPLGKPAAFAVAVLAFLFHWSNFTDALLFLHSEQRYTVALGLRALQALEPALHSIFLAGAVVATIPAVIAFFLAQRAFFSKSLEV
jgi:multiple sugar transport system permease protein